MKEYKGRLPDKETEHLRIWNSNINEVDDYDEEERFEVEMEDGVKLKCLGFTKVSNKETHELLFAYKFKHEFQNILYYVPKETSQTQEFIEFLDFISSNIGYSLQDIRETFKDVKYELKLAEKENVK